ncbi:MAG: thiamine pyrophosphate-dependent enzyme [bacterium]|nr:thiamine pyrophosphate-dependent enzyme [bacterium]
MTSRNRKATKSESSGRALSKETLLNWYYQMVLIREFETRCDELYHQKKITGVYLHLYSGHEATGVGAVAALEQRDHVITAYRDHGIALARGVDANRIMAEMIGKVDGVSGGKGGSMHLASREHNFWGGYAIVGGHLPLATGIAFASRYNNTDEVTISFVGDGATNNGYFHESVNMAGVWDLPVVWIIENNFVGMGTRVEDASGQPELHKRAIAYGIKDAGRVDGQDVEAVYNVVKDAVEYARTSGSVLIESITYRYKGHGVSDRSFDKRFADELQEWTTNKDPITLLRKRLVNKYEDDIQTELHRLEREAKEVVDQSVEFATNSPEPGYEHLIRNVYVEE